MLFTGYLWLPSYSSKFLEYHQQVDTFEQILLTITVDGKKIFSVISITQRAKRALQTNFSSESFSPGTTMLADTSPPPLSSRYLPKFPPDTISKVSKFSRKKSMLKSVPCKLLLYFSKFKKKFNRMVIRSFSVEMIHTASCMDYTVITSPVCQLDKRLFTSQRRATTQMREMDDSFSLYNSFLLLSLSISGLYLSLKFQSCTAFKFNKNSNSLRLSL